MTGCNSAIKAARAQRAGVAEHGSISRACSAIANQRRAAEHHIDADQHPDSPGCGAGQACENDPVMIRSMMPLASIQPHHPDSSRLCSSANIIEATPSITKYTMRTKVSERTPLNGHNSSTVPAAIPRIAETSDHLKPGAWRIRKVVINRQFR